MRWEENVFDIRNENCIKHNWRKFQRHEAELGSVIYASADFARELKEIMILACFSLISILQVLLQAKRTPVWFSFVCKNLR